MQLHNYWDIVVSRIGVVVGAFLVAVVAATASVFFVPQTAAPYQASLVLAVKPQAEPGSDNYYRYDGYYAYVSSEYTNDDLISIIQTTDFLQAVRDHLQSKIGSAPTGSLDGKKAHRVVTITASSPTFAPGGPTPTTTTRTWAPIRNCSGPPRGTTSSAATRCRGRRNSGRRSA